uniref:Uncharacterized protein n=1 Tax=Janibacter limosus TaxID=53458 RepID=A0AC61U7S8_9MICO|nr:hypothetical protein [Janibacter limosus]
MAKTTGAQKALTYGSVAVGSALAGAGSVWMGGATYFARKVLTPDLVRPDDTQIHVIHSDSLTLSGPPDLLVPGRYGLWLDGGRGHARIGAMLEVDHRRQTVRRELLGVDSGVLQTGSARFNGYYYGGDPRSDPGARARGHRRTHRAGSDAGSGWCRASTVTAPAGRCSSTGGGRVGTRPCGRSRPCMPLV